MNEPFGITELFDAKTVAVDSPRKRWMKRTGLKTFKSPSVPADEEPWNAWVGELSDAIDRDEVDHGATEDEAITNWCKRTGTRLWNEE